MVTAWGTGYDSMWWALYTTFTATAEGKARVRLEMPATTGGLALAGSGFAGRGTKARLAGFREFAGEDPGYLLSQMWDLVGGGGPDDLQVEVEIRVNNAVADGDDLAPGHFGVAVAEFGGQAVDGLADDRQMMEDGGRQDLISDERCLGRSGSDVLDFFGRPQDILEIRGFMPHK